MCVCVSESEREREREREREYVCVYLCVWCRKYPDEIAQIEVGVFCQRGRALLVFFVSVAVPIV